MSNLNWYGCWKCLGLWHPGRSEVGAAERGPWPNGVQCAHCNGKRMLLFAQWFRAQGIYCPTDDEGDLYEAWQVYRERHGARRIPLPSWIDPPKCKIIPFPSAYGTCPPVSLN